MRLLLAVLFCSFFASLPALAQTDFFPLATGSEWIYEAKVKWATDDEKEHSKTLSWTTKIESAINRDNNTYAIGSGLPGDLCFYTEDVKPGRFMFIRVGQWKLFAVYNQEKIDEIWNKAINPDENLRDIVTEEDLLLDLPLIPGKTYGNTAQVTSIYNSHLYQTDSVASFSADKINGLIMAQPSNEYFINYRTGPDTTNWSFVPGVGFTSYFYFHNGQTSEVECTLKEVKFTK